MVDVSREAELQRHLPPSVRTLKSKHFQTACIWMQIGFDYGWLSMHVEIRSNARIYIEFEIFHSRTLNDFT